MYELRLSRIYIPQVLARQNVEGSGSESNFTMTELAPRISPLSEKQNRPIFINSSRSEDGCIISGHFSIIFYDGKYGKFLIEIFTIIIRYTLI
jgi:hypothetical protein